METTTAPWNMSVNGTSMPSQPQPSISREILRILLSVTIGIVMIGMGCGVDLQKLKGHLKKPKGVVVGFVSQFVFMPAIAFALAKIAQMGDLQTLALLLVGSCPGGTTSNVATYWVDGDMDLSVTMTTVSSVLGLGMMPLLLWIYSFGFENTLLVPFSTIGITLASLIAPIAVGIFVRIKFPQYAPKLLKILSVVGIIVIVSTTVLSFVTYNGAFVILPSQVVCAAIFPGVGMLLGYGLSSLVSLKKTLFLYHRQRRTISIETGIQNTQLAAAIIQLSGFTRREVGQIILFPIVYLVFQLTWVALMLVTHRIYLCKHPQVAAPEDETKFDDDKEKHDVKLEEGVVNGAFTSPQPPNYDEVVDAQYSHSTSM